MIHSFWLRNILCAVTLTTAQASLKRERSDDQTPPSDQPFSKVRSTDLPSFEVARQQRFQLEQIGKFTGDSEEFAKHHQTAFEGFTPVELRELLSANSPLKDCLKADSDYWKLQKELSDILSKEPDLKILRIKKKIPLMPPVVGKFKTLNELNLHSANIVVVPEFIADLKTLEILNLDYNLLTFLPLFTSKLTNLKIITAYNNNLRRLPETLTDLKSLQAIKISGFHFGNLNVTSPFGIAVETAQDSHGATSIGSQSHSLRNQFVLDYRLNLLELNSIKVLDRLRKAAVKVFYYHGK